MRSLVTAILIATVSISACGSSGGSPEDVVQEFYDSALDGRLENALELFVVEKRNRKDAYLRSLAKVRDELNARSFSGLTIKGTNEENNSMRVYITVNFDSGNNMDGGAQTILEDGKWKIKSLYVPGRGGHQL